MLALTFGAGFTALVFVTVGITWLIGIALLSPGIWLTSLISNGRFSLILMFIANTVIYSMPSYLLAIPLVRAEKSSARIFAVSVLCAVTIVLAAWMGTREFEKSGAGVCGNEEVSHSVSPDGTHKVIVFIRDCGVLGEDSTQVFLVDQNRELNHLDTGNVLVTDEWDNVAAQWQSPNSIRVAYPQAARIMRKEDKVGNVSIEYETH